MKLGHIFQSYAVWTSLSKLKLSPSLAYKVLKYLRLISSEYELIDKHRVSLIYDITGADINSPVSIEPNTDEHKQYIERFGAFLNSDSDLELLDIQLDDFVKDLGSDNKLSVEDINLLEPFFKI